MVQKKLDSFHSKKLRRIPDVVVGLFVLKPEIYGNEYTNLRLKKPCDIPTYEIP